MKRNNGILLQLSMYFRKVSALIPYYVFIFSFFLTSQFGKHFFFSFSYLSGIRIDYLAPTIYLTDILSLPLIVYALITYISSKHYIKAPFISAAALLFFFNMLFSQSLPLWGYQFIRVVQWIGVCHFFLITSKDKAIFSAAIGGLLIGGMLEFGLALYQLSSRGSLQGLAYYLGERRFTITTPGIAKAYFLGREFLRPYATFSHPNSLAGFYLLVYSFLLTNKRITNPFFKTFAVFLVSSLVIITFSRVAIITYVAISLIYFFNKAFTCRICTISKLILAIFLVTFALTITGDMHSLQKRSDFAEKALMIIANKPFSGTGMGGYLIAQHAFPQKFSTFFEQPVHNIFLLVIAQLGIPLSLILFGWIAQKLGKNMKNNSFLLPALCIFITGNADHYWITLQQNVLVTAVIFGILFVYEDKTTPARTG